MMYVWLTGKCMQILSYHSSITFVKCSLLSGTDICGQNIFRFIFHQFFLLMHNDSNFNQINVSTTFLPCHETLDNKYTSFCVLLLNVSIQF